jgi:beta-glucosidase
VAVANPHTVVVLVGGSAVVTEAWRAQVPAILMAWYSGMEGGHALADLLFGNANPSGKLPCVFPRSADHLPFFDRTAAEIEYDLLHGYRLLDSAGHEPAFPFGFGLSYTNYEYRNLRVSDEVVGPEDTLAICVDVANRGKRQGEKVVQLYAGCPGLAVKRPPRELKAFVRVPLNAGETRQVTFDLPVRRLAYYDVGTSKWSVEPGTYSIHAGGSSHPADLLSAGFQVHLP